jgi:hypothetical protein
MTQTTDQGTTPQTSVLDSLVGDGKKFNSAEALARGKQEADAFIETLKREKQEALDLVARQDTRIKTLESKSSILDRLSNPDTTVNQTDVQNQTPLQPSAKGLTEEDVLKVVEKRDANAAATKNKTVVDAGLVKVFGANAADEVRKRCSELGVDPQTFNQLALTSPQAAFALLNINPNAAQGNTTYTGSGRDVTLVNGKPQVRNNAFYEALKKQMGPLKFMRDSGLMVQRHRDMEALGDSWDS